MTGRITILNRVRESGFIKSESGHSYFFEASGVMQYDPAMLVVGQSVTFDLGSGDRLRAVNVCCHRRTSAAPADDSKKEPLRLRYMGFEQSGNLREYRFERMVRGRETESFAMTTDLKLFSKHNVSIQDGPGLCLQLLTVGLEGGGQWAPLRTVTDEEVLAFATARPAPKTRPGPRKKPAAAPVTQA